MAKRDNVRVGLIVLSAVALVVLLKGLLAGVNRDWTNMTLYLGSFILNVFVLTSAMVILTADRCLRRIARRFGDSQGVLHRPYGGAIGLTGLAMVICVGVLLSLCWFCALRQNTFALGICMTICAIVVFVSMGAVTALAILARFERLEELLFGIPGASQHEAE